MENCPYCGTELEIGTKCPTPKCVWTALGPISPENRATKPTKSSLLIVVSLVGLVATTIGLLPYYQSFPVHSATVTIDGRKVNLTGSTFVTRIGSHNRVKATITATIRLYASIGERHEDKLTTPERTNGHVYVRFVTHGGMDDGSSTINARITENGKKIDFTSPLFPLPRTPNRYIVHIDVMDYERKVVGGYEQRTLVKFPIEFVPL